MNELARWDPFSNGLTESTRWNPFEDSGFGLIPTLFRPVARSAAGFRMDVEETDNAYLLAVELPGARKEAIQVQVYENSVTIGAEIAEGEKPAGEERKWLLRERSTGKTQRTVTLPESLDENASEAKFADGVLYLKLQKKRASQVKRLAVH